jgi:hypothetical protein
LRQLAIGLLWLDKHGLRAAAEERVTAMLAQHELQWSYGQPKPTMDR